jgi:RNA polymerase sigma-70 factor (ECF subfamily)
MTFEAFYRVHYPMVFRFALFLSGDRAEAEDIAQETFVRAWSSDAPLRARSVEAYLLTVARNLHRRSRRRAPNLPLDVAEFTDATPLADVQVLHREALTQLAKRLRALDERDRAALLMRAIGGLSYDEIGRALGLTAGAAKVRVHRIRNALKTGDHDDGA